MLHLGAAKWSFIQSFLGVLEVKLESLCLLGKYFTDWATSPPPALCRFPQSSLSSVWCGHCFLPHVISVAPESCVTNSNFLSSGPWLLYTPALTYCSADPTSSFSGALAKSALLLNCVFFFQFSNLSAISLLSESVILEGHEHLHIYLFLYKASNSWRQKLYFPAM